MFARSINFVRSWTEMHESSINNLSKGHCTTSVIFVLRVSAKPTVCARVGTSRLLEKGHLAAAALVPPLKRKVLTGAWNLRGCAVLNSLIGKVYLELLAKKSP